MKKSNMMPTSNAQQPEQLPPGFPFYQQPTQDKNIR